MDSAQHDHEAVVTPRGRAPMPQTDAAAAASSAASSSSAAAAPAAFEDITARLRAACALLPRGALLPHASFTLKQSMSALELGDAKMDAAAHVPRGTISVDAALSSGLILPGSALTLFHQLELIDEFLALEVSWYNGSSLAHSLYTCFYLHRLSLIHPVCPVLSAYVLLGLKSVALLREVIVSADLYKDEEFHYQDHGIKVGAWEIGQDFRNGFSTAAPSVEAALGASASSQNQSNGSNGAAAAVPAPGQPFGGLSVHEVIANFRAQLASLHDRIAALRAADPSAPSEAELQSKPAEPESSELHLLTLLRSRFEFRDAWYQLHLVLRTPPLLLRPNLTAARPLEAQINAAIQSMRASCRGSSEEEEEKKRAASEAEYHAQVAQINRAYAASVAAAAAAGQPRPALPSFPKKPSANLAARDLSFGFDARLTIALIQTSPPRRPVLLYRRDALGWLADFMAHYAMLHLLPPLALRGMDAILFWMEQWHALRPNIILRSQLWHAAICCLHPRTYPDGEASLPGGVPPDPSQDLFAFLQDVSPEAAMPACYGSLTPGAQMALQKELAVAEGHLSTRELLVRGHALLAPSLEPQIFEVLKDESGLRRQHQPVPVLDPARDPMTYGFLCTRMLTPLQSYVKILLGHHSAFRRELLSTEVGTVHLDWNILMSDARTVDEALFGGLGPRTALQAEEARVAVPPGLSAAQRSSHPHMLYHHSCYSLVLDRCVSIQLSYLLSGLESSLYSPRELQVTLYVMEHLCNLRLHNRTQCYRERDDLLALKKPLDPVPVAVKGGAGAKGNRATVMAPRKYPYPPSIPAQPPLWNADMLLVEAHQYLCRGLIQMMEACKRIVIEVAPSAAENAAADPQAKPRTLGCSVPAIDPSMMSTWFSHRYRDLSLLTLPAAPTLDDYLAVLTQFDGVPAAPAAAAAAADGSSASAASAASAAAAARVDAIFTMSLRSLQRSKELLQIISTDQSRSAADEAAAIAAAAPSRSSSSSASAAVAGAAPSSFVPRLSCALPGASLKSLQRVCVANSMLALSYKKSVAAAAAAGSALQLDMRWDSYGGSVYTPLHADRKVPFPVLSLRIRQNH